MFMRRLPGSGNFSRLLLCLTKAARNTLKHMLHGAMSYVNLLTQRKHRLDRLLLCCCLRTGHVYGR